MKNLCIIFLLFLVSCKGKNFDKHQLTSNVDDVNVLSNLDTITRMRGKQSECYIMDLKVPFVGNSFKISLLDTYQNNPDIAIINNNSYGEKSKEKIYVKKLKNNIAFAVNSKYKSILRIDSSRFNFREFIWSDNKVLNFDKTWFDEKEGFVYTRIIEKNDTIYNWINMSISTLTFENDSPSKNDSCYQVLVYSFSITPKKK